jgi:hypothetical protein
VEKVVAAAHAADAAFVAVELLFGQVVVVQVAHCPQARRTRRSVGTVAPVAQSERRART